ncbi:hypothetical protein ACH4YO_08000 [Streptomyces noursei]|uniref:hypothetical protein n=1 Tax=Streptomyces noursei TaxID=1971 RepID=UPI0033E09E14
MTEVVIEEGHGEDAGTFREFWVSSTHGLRSTLSFEADGSGVEVKWYVDSPEYFGPEFEAGFAMRLTDVQAERLVACVQRELRKEADASADA